MANGHDVKPMYKYIASVGGTQNGRKYYETGEVFGNSLKEVRKAIYQKIKAMDLDRRLYFGKSLHPQYSGGIRKYGWRQVGDSKSKEWGAIDFVAYLVYDTGSGKLIQGEVPSSPKEVVQTWRIIHADGSLGKYIKFSRNLI